MFLISHGDPQFSIDVQSQWSQSYSASARAERPAIDASYTGQYAPPIDPLALRAATIALAILMIVCPFLSLLFRTRAGILPILLGKDGRLSTSQFQAWTFFFFISQAVLKNVPSDVGSSTPTLGTDCLLLLGGPFAALVASQLIGQTKETNETVQKVSAFETKIADLISTTAGAQTCSTRST